jgi:hypothetical protein
MPAEKVAELFISVFELAALLNLHDRTVRVLVGRKIIPRAPNGKYPVGPCVTSYCRYLQEQVQTRTKPTMAASRMKLIGEQKRRLKLANDVASGTLMKRSDALETAEEMSVAFVQAAEALPGRVAGELAALDSPAHVRARLKEEVKNMRKSISDILDELGTNKTRGRPRAPKDGEHAGSVGGLLPADSAGESGTGPLAE